MTNVVPTVEVPVNVNTVPVKTDAANRAVRTFIQSAATDIGAALGGVVLLGVSDVHWTNAWWIGFGVLLGKTVVVTGLSYVGRFLAKPKGAVAK